jgi:hypothetical protein
MYRSDHVALAKAVRDGAAAIDLSADDTAVLAKAIADVCDDRTPASAKFDPELFMAYALSPVLPSPAKTSPKE